MFVGSRSHLLVQLAQNNVEIDTAAVTGVTPQSQLEHIINNVKERAC